MERYVYVDDSGNRRPVTEDEIHKLVIRGVCTSDTIIEECGEKKRIGQIPALSWICPDANPAQQAPNKSP